MGGGGSRRAGWVPLYGRDVAFDVPQSIAPVSMEVGMTSNTRASESDQTRRGWESEEWERGPLRCTPPPKIRRGQSGGNRQEERVKCFVT